MLRGKGEKLAILIDAENAQAGACSKLLEEVSKFGISTVKRAYGDWTTDRLKSWKPYLHRHAIQPIQQFSYTTGKNASDSALIIDAMDLLHTGNLDGFCLVSSDSDFTRLATRIREDGLVVYGFGEQKTPEAFISACDKFIFTENLRRKDKIDDENLLDRKLEELVSTAIDAVSDESGWALLAGVGAYITKNNPSFDPRNYGFEKLGKLVKSLEYIEIREERFNDQSSNVHIYIRIVEK